MNAIYKLYIYTMEPDLTLNFVTVVDIEELDVDDEYDCFCQLYYNEIERKVMMLTEETSKAILTFKLDEHKKPAAIPEFGEIGLGCRCIGYNS